MAIIYHQIVIKAVRPKVYEAITTQEGFTRWWTTDCVVKPQVGFINEFQLGLQAHYRMKVIHLQAGLSVEWKCMNQHDDWSGTQLSFHLTDRGGDTCLDFKHSGFSTENEAYAASNYQWALYLKQLKEYCEKGEQETGGPKVDAVKVSLQTGKN